MCYHFKDNDTQDYIDWFVKKHGIKAYIWQGTKYYVNGFAHGINCVITQGKPDEIQELEWGLIPFFAKSEKEAAALKAQGKNAISAYDLQQQTLNAKSETVFQLASFRHCIKKQKCLIFASGFFEWRHLDAKNKIPYVIGVRNKELPGKFKPFTFGGIYDQWTDKDTGEVHDTFAIITTPANEMMEIIHNSKKRMPLIIPEEVQWDWLTTTDEKRIKELMVPFPKENMLAHPVSKLVSQQKIEKNCPEVIEPADYAEIETAEFL